MIGIDIVDVDRFNDLVNSDSFLSKYFSSYEVEYIKSKHTKTQTMAGLFACKEAFIKALGEGIGGAFNLKDINVKHNLNGKPFIDVTDKLKNYFKQHNFNQIECSISHTDKLAIAIVNITNA